MREGSVTAGNVTRTTAYALLPGGALGLLMGWALLDAAGSDA